MSRAGLLRPLSLAFIRTAAIRERDDGAYYKMMVDAACRLNPDIITITRVVKIFSLTPEALLIGAFFNW